MALEFSPISLSCCEFNKINFFLLVSKTTNEQSNHKSIYFHFLEINILWIMMIMEKLFDWILNTYRLLSKRSRPADCDVLNWYNITKNYISYRPIHSKIELVSIQHHLMRSLCLAMVYHTVDNNLNDMMNRLVLNYQVFRLIYRRYDKPMRNKY